MSAIFVVLTLVVVAIGPLFVVLGLTTPGPAAPTLLVTGVGVLLVCVGVWLWSRPTRFDVSPYGLTIVWPLRRRALTRAAITSVRIVPRAELRGELGFALRVGVGGLFGTFGLLWTTKRGWVGVYISTTDGFVIVETRDGRALLITPEDAEGFVRQWDEGAARSSAF